MTTQKDNSTQRLIFILIALGCLAGAAMLWFRGMTASAVADQGWTAQEKAAYLAIEKDCPKTECLAAWWHPDLRKVIIEVPQDFQVVSPEWPVLPLNDLQPQLVRQGTLPESVTSALVKLPEGADSITIIAQPAPLTDAEQQALMERVATCTPRVDSVGANGRFISISIQGLMEGLGQGITVDEFFTPEERQCLSDLLHEGYHISYSEEQPASAL